MWGGDHHPLPHAEGLWELLSHPSTRIEPWALTQSCSRISSSIFTASTLAACVFLVKYRACGGGEE